MYSLELLCHFLILDAISLIVAHLELSGVFTLVGGGLSDLLVLFLPLDAALDRLLFVGDAALQLEYALLTTTLLLSDVII